MAHDMILLTKEVLIFMGGRMNSLIFCKFSNSRNSLISKIIEVIVKSRLTEHLPSNNLFNTRQSAYSKLRCVASSNVQCADTGLQQCYSFIFGHFVELSLFRI